MQDLLEISEFSPLTASALSELLTPEGSTEDRGADNGRRTMSRWPFPATVELWVPAKRDQEDHVLATCMNLSSKGIGIRTSEPLSPETQLSIAIHQPEKTLYGRATVRHCTEIAEGYYVGMEFAFEKEATEMRPATRTRHSPTSQHTRSRSR